MMMTPHIGLESEVIRREAFNNGMQETQGRGTMLSNRGSNV